MPAASPFLPFALPDIGDDEIAEVVDTLKSGWITTGPKARRFEDDFSAFLGDASLQSLASTRHRGLHLALEALGIGPGDEVITTTHTFTATAEVVRYLGADVKLGGHRPGHAAASTSAASKRPITPRTKAVHAVHYAGRAADMQPLLALAKRQRPEGRGGRGPCPADDLRRPLVGTLDSDADGVQLLRQQDHHDGEGGMVVTRDGRPRKRMRVMRCTA
jgi:dTDP-4-amino-4,6-dideoxygalactose transaminase